MNIQEAIAYIHSYTWSQWKLGLDRTRELLERLGNPQQELHFVHVAGSNGKGSFCAMLERILRSAGYKTGFYPSPYIEDFRERIQVNGELIPEDALCRLTERVRTVADRMDEHPTQFELITAIGMLYFAEEQCDIVVLEVGLGGTFDATNVIDAPELAVLMHIGLEHTEYLGNTLTEIAETKAGIIKTGADVIFYENDEETAAVIRRICKARNCPLHEVDFARIQNASSSLSGQSFDFINPAGEELHITLPLLGIYQLYNAATVLTAVEVLRTRHWEISDVAITEGLANTSWPARFEVLQNDPLFILDGGHNPQCAEALAESLAQYIDGPVIFLMGILGDKNVGQVLDIVAPYAEEFICATPDSERALPAEELAARIQTKGLPATTCASVEEAVRLALAQAKEKQLPVVAFGSLYMAGEIRKLIRGRFLSVCSEQ